MKEWWNVCFSTGASSPRGWQYNNNISFTCMVVMSDWRTWCILIYWAQKKKKSIHYITHTLELCSDIAELLEDPVCSEEVNVSGFNGRKTNRKKMKKKQNTEPNKMWNWMYSMMSVHMCGIVEGKTRFIFLFSCIRSSERHTSRPNTVVLRTADLHLHLLNGAARICQQRNTFCHSEVQSSFYQDNP